MKCDICDRETDELADCYAKIFNPVTNSYEKKHISLCYICVNAFCGMVTRSDTQISQRKRDEDNV